MNEFFDGPLSHKAQYMSITGSLVLLGITIFLIRQNKLKPAYSFLWFSIGGIILIISLFTNILFLLSNILGIFYPPAALFSVLFVGLILIQIHFSIIATRHERRIKKLTQEIALIKEKVKSNKRS